MLVVLLQRTSDQHGTDGEYLLSICVSTDISESDTGEAAEGEIERCDVGTTYGWPPEGAVQVWALQTLPQLVQPTCGRTIQVKQHPESIKRPNVSAKLFLLAE